MKRWKLLQGNNFRVELDLSQQDLADYLEVSKGLLAMYEIDQRNLPGEASRKLAQLQEAYYALPTAKKQGRSMFLAKNSLLMQEDKIASDSLSLASYKRLTAGRLEHKLAAITEKQQRLGQWLDAIDHKLDEVSHALSKQDRAWLLIQQAEVAEKLLKNNLAFLKLRLKADHLLASADVHERHQQRLMNKR